MVQCRAFILNVLTFPLYSQDGCRRIGSPTRGLLRIRLPRRQRNPHMLHLGAYRRCYRHSATSATDHAASINYDAVSVRTRCCCCFEIPRGRAWNLHLLPDRISQTRGSGSESVNVSTLSGVKTGAMLLSSVPQDDRFLRRHYRHRGGYARNRPSAVAGSPVRLSAKRTSRGNPMGSEWASTGH
jgi:hypothetical protein